MKKLFLFVLIIPVFIAGCSNNSVSEDDQVNAGCQFVRQGWAIGGSNNEAGQELYLKASKIFNDLENSNSLYSSFALGLLRASRGEISLELYDVAAYCGIDVG